MAIIVWPVDAVPPPSLGTVAIAITTGVLTVSATETLAPGDPVVLGAVTGAAPLVAGTTYYVLTAPTSTTLTLSATVGGAMIVTTASGTSTSIARVNGAPSFTGRALREAQSVYLAGASTADPFGVRSGVRPGTSPTTITATGTTWTVGAHAGALDLETAVEASGYAYAVNATGGLPTGPVTAANATYPRHDVIYAHLDDPAESDGSSVPAVTFGYVAGTVLTAGTLEITALPARSVAYATVNVPISGGGAPTVTWVAPYTVAAGGVLPVAAGVRPASPYLGQYIDDATAGLLRYDGTAWMGGAWIASTGFLVSTTGVAMTNYVATQHYAMNNKTVHLRWTFVPSAGFTPGTGEIIIGLPVAADTTVPLVGTFTFYDSSTGFKVSGYVQLANSAQALFRYLVTQNSAESVMIPVSAPVVWAVNDNLEAILTYEAA